jgi:hypothetical protein
MSTCYNNCGTGIGLEQKMHYFPITPRLRSIYKSPTMARLMRWHEEYKSEDHIMRGPADSPAWKCANRKWTFLKDEPRHVRFGMAMDGINPHGNNSSSYSTWPIVLVNYNLPPWMSIKAVHLILCAIVPSTISSNLHDTYEYSFKLIQFGCSL